jgi:signal transduction histidine kinase
MISIINELLDLARIEARRGKDFSIAAVDAQALLQNIVAGFKAPDNRASPVTPAAAGPLWIRADRNKLTQAISNVLSNAYKYSPDGGEVDLVLTESPGDGDAPLRIGIRITDHGIGMTPEQLARVCERFYRADTSGKIPGTGLGMSIVKEIVELHGGELEITSEVGTGSTVTIWLPDIAAAVLTQVPDVLPILQKEQQI